MEVLGVISSDVRLNETIRQVNLSCKNRNHQLLFLTSEEKINEFINYELPELIIVNFADPILSADTIINCLEKDVWLHSFGIIGIFKQASTNEEDLLSRLKNLNILSLINEYRIRSHLMKSVEIIHKNRQIVLQKGLGSTIINNSSGSFIIPNDILSVPIYAGLAATSLSLTGKISVDRKMHLQLSLAELIINGIEHGNCNIDFHEKTKFMDNGQSIVDLVAEKCKNEEIAKKNIKLEWEINNDFTKYTITDEGSGFDTEKINKILKSQDIFSLHGRGIRMARKLSKELSYNDKGNQVTIIIEHEKNAEPQLPIFYKKEEIISVKRGDIIFNEVEESDFLYYIASGRYYIFHKKKRVGEIDRNDIFMGEMSFLLRNTRTGTIKAAEDGKLIKISRRDFVTLVKEYPYYGILLSRLLAKRLAKANEINMRLAKKLKT